MVKKGLLTGLSAALIVLALFLVYSRPADARYAHYGAGGRTWYPTRSFTGNYYGGGGYWGSYNGGYLYGPGNYGGMWWQSGATGRWWYGR